MAYFTSLDQPVSIESPCGVDVDSDADMQSFLTMAEGALPASFREFKRSEFDDKGHLEKIEKFLAKSRDLRLLILAAKTFALSDNFDGFFECLDAATALLGKYWTESHPQAIGGDYALRAAYLQSLDDRPTIVMPLQCAPLIKDKRLGVVAYRAFMVARKPALAKPGEEVRDEGTLHDAFSRFEPLGDLIALRDKFKDARINLDKLRNLFIEHVSHEAAPQYELLPAFLQDVEAYLSGIIAERSPQDTEAIAVAGDGEASSDTASEGLQPAVVVTNMSTAQEVGHALEAVAVYFSKIEPSSPARLLVRLAQQLVGKSFVEAMSVVAPALVDDVKVTWTGETPFSLNFGHLRDLAPGDSAPLEMVGDSGTFSVATRSEAVELMKAVEKYYQKWEPSSPTPMLLERARKFMARDFSSLLAELVRKTD